MSTGDSEESRILMKIYWDKHSDNASIEEMFLDTNAEAISEKEMPEIFSILPSYKDKSVLELGAGIGRFTTFLAKEASKVTAIDFIEKFIEKNREINSQFKNIDFVHADVTTFNFGKNQYDLIFINWLLMYLNDQEVQDLVDNCLHNIKLNGYFFFRESCFHPSGNIKQVSHDENPTYYRSPKQYIDYFQSKVFEENGKSYGFELVFARPSRTYIEMKNNRNQIYFLFKKIEFENFHGYKTFQEFLDKKQYTLTGILQYEKIFGSGFISPGGKDSSEKILNSLDLKKKQKILDVGCGIGGADFMMAEAYGVEVFGLDLSANVIGLAWDRSKNYKDLNVSFEIGDVTKYEYPSEYFDVIYSRDTILHIEDKKALFNRFMTWLKPGGKVFITDYTCGPKPWSDEYTAYVEQRGYTLLTVEEYGKLFTDLGFINVKAEDKTEEFVYYLNVELENAKRIKEDFIAEFSEKNYEYIVNGWENKSERCSQGYQKWGHIYVEKK